jgi:hypothetical protein
MNVILLGTAPSSMSLAPFGNPEWEIWACSPGTYGLAVQNGVKFDKFFELHRWEKHQPWFSEGYVDFLRNFDGEVIMSEAVPEVKGCALLPWQYLVSKYGPYFFTSSLAWMMAMAIEAGAKKIGLYGVDMAATTEYLDQRLGCQYFAQLAVSKGIEVGVPPESDLLRPAPLYGICETSHAWIKQRSRNIEINGRLKDAQERYKTAHDEIHFLQGVLDDQDWQLHSWFGGIDTQGQFFTAPPKVPALMHVHEEPLEEFVEEVKPKRGRPPKKKARGRPRKS